MLDNYTVRNIRNPLTGSVMTVALKDIIHLRDILDPASVSLNDTDAVYKKLHTFNRQRKAHSTSLNILAQALYTFIVAASKFCYQESSSRWQY
jgi:squalene monooxygenase